MTVAIWTSWSDEAFNAEKALGKVRSQFYTYTFGLEVRSQFYAYTTGLKKCDRALYPNAISYQEVEIVAWW
ncbi:MAG: hypothetical protein ACTS2F_22180 [Thainema sp.]